MLDVISGGGGCVWEGGGIFAGLGTYHLKFVSFATYFKKICRSLPLDQVNSNPDGIF